MKSSATASISPSEMLDRLPPQDLNAEKQVLGSILLNPRIIDEITLSGADFYSDANRRIFECMVAMRDARKPIDVYSLFDALKAAGSLEATGGQSYMAEIAGSVAVWAHYRHHVSIITRHACNRRIIQIASSAIRDAFEPGADPAKLITQAEAAFSRLDGSEEGEDPQGMQDVLVRALEQVENVAERGEHLGVPTGLARFDEEIGGLFPRELTILAARPRIGKTALASQIALHLGNRGRAVYFATVEMGRVELATRMLCTHAGVSGQKIRNATIETHEKASLVRAANLLAKANITLHDRPRMSVYDIRRAVRRASKDGLSLVVVDYLTLVEPPDRRKKRYEQVGDITKELKAIAKECNVPVLCLAQLNRDLDRTTAVTGRAKVVRRPNLADLRESGDIEQDADMIIFLHRQAAGYRSEEDDSAELLIDKNRNGACGSYKLRWQADVTKYVDDAEVPAWEDDGGTDSGWD